MDDAAKAKALKGFLYAYGVISLALFTSLFVLTLFDAPVIQEGGALRFLRWEPLAKHIELMIEIVYIVWGVFFFRAARDPEGYRSFIDFTIWANLAHGLLMVAQTIAMPQFMHKMYTDNAYCLVLAFGPLWLRPQARRA